LVTSGALRAIRDMLELFPLHVPVADHHFSQFCTLIPPTKN